MQLPVELIRLKLVFGVEFVERHFVMKLDELAKFDKHLPIHQNLKPNYHLQARSP
jgi:hypothetical protein